MSTIYIYGYYSPTYLPLDFYIRYDSSVIRVKLDELLEKRKRSLYVVAKDTGISYLALSKIRKNQVQRISFDVLEKLCKNLNCKPNDLFEIVD